MRIVLAGERDKQLYVMVKSFYSGRLKINLVEDVSAIILLGIIYYAFLFKYPFSYNYQVGINTHYFIFLPAIIFFSVFQIIHFCTEQSKPFNFIDLICGVLFIYSLACIVIGHPFLNLDNEFFTCCLLILIIYGVIRQSSVYLLRFFMPILIAGFFLSNWV